MGFLRRFAGTPRDRLAREVMAELRRAGFPDATYDPDAFAISFRWGPDETVDVLLHNTFSESERLGWHVRYEVIRRLVGTLVQAPASTRTWEDARPLLLPALRSAHLGLRAPIADPAMAFLSRPALPYLHEYVVVDLSTSGFHPAVWVPDQWGVPVDEVFAAARANLMALPAEPVWERGPTSEQAMLRYVDRGYATSRLLLDGWLAGLAGRVGGRPVAFAPNPSILVVVPDQPDVLPRWFKFVELEYIASAERLSPQAYTVSDDGSVVPYPVFDGHSLAAAVRRADTRLAAREYAAEAEWLERRHAQDEPRVLVAALGVFTRLDGSIFSVASWAEGVDTLLPQADYIAFSGQGHEPFYVAWSVVLAEVDLGPVAGLRVPRYRVTGWPQASTMERLRARATTP